MYKQLAITLNEENALPYRKGAGSTLKFPTPLTSMVAKELCHAKGPEADKQKIDDAIKVCGEA